METAKITTEQIEKVEHVKRLPICVTRTTFVLPFEKNELKFGKVFQLQMLRDAAHGERLLGIWYCNPGEAPVDERPPAGSVGCAAQIRNIKISKGGGKIVKLQSVARFRILEYVETEKLYPVAEVEFFKDDPEPEEVIRQAWLKTDELMWRIVKKASEAVGKPIMQPIPLPPVLLSFAISDLFRLGNDTKKRFLEMRKTSERLLAAYEILNEWDDSYHDTYNHQQFASYFKPNIDKPGA